METVSTNNDFIQKWPSVAGGGSFQVPRVTGAAAGEEEAEVQKRVLEERWGIYAIKLHSELTEQLNLKLYDAPNLNFRLSKILSTFS